VRCPPIPINPFLAHRRGLSFRNLSVEVVRRDAALKTLCINALHYVKLFTVFAKFPHPGTRIKTRARRKAYMET
jgi:hypothetical protein